MSIQEIPLQTELSTTVSRDDVRYILNSALQREASLASVRRAYFERACRVFEQQHHLSSEEFMRQFESGALGDEAAYFDWYAAKRGLDVWEQRFRILSGARV